VFLLDPSGKDVRLNAKDLFGKIIKPVTFRWKDWLPDDKARSEFADRAFEDFYNPEYHFYTTMYLSFTLSLQDELELKLSYCIIGRRPQA